MEDLNAWGNTYVKDRLSLWDTTHNGIHFAEDIKMSVGDQSVTGRPAAIGLLSQFKNTIHTAVEVITQKSDNDRIQQFVKGTVVMDNVPVPLTYYESTTLKKGGSEANGGYEITNAMGTIHK